MTAPLNETKIMPRYAITWERSTAPGSTCGGPAGGTQHYTGANEGEAIQALRDEYYQEWRLEPSDIIIKSAIEIDS